MRPYTDGDLGIEEKLKCPVFNEYFIIGNVDNSKESGMSTSNMSAVRIGFQTTPPEYFSSSPMVRSTPRSRRNYGYSEFREADTRELANNLYTFGGEYRLPDGTEYVGFYHIHPEKGAMVGRAHSPEPHGLLTQIQTTRRQPSIPNMTRRGSLLRSRRQTTSTGRARPRQMSRGPSGGGSSGY